MTFSPSPLRVQHLELLADTVTPVGAFLRLRDHFTPCVLLESADSHGQENAFSYLACDPLATFEVRGGAATVTLPGQAPREYALPTRRAARELLAALTTALRPTDPLPAALPELGAGLFGFMSYEAVALCEDLDLDAAKPATADLPTLRYDAFRYVVAFDHFRQRLHLLEFTPAGEEARGLDALAALVLNPATPRFEFSLRGAETSNQTDEEFLRILAQGQHHCQRGDVFQIVLSRRFQQAYRGDDFNVYRALRAVSPSPYLFYFDYGTYRLLGSSPEAQLRIRGREAHLHPIAGTFRRTGHDAQDAELARQLAADPKENAEHVMLVDLARNDLARFGTDVRVAVFREVQYYSHVLHLVSHVTARLAPDAHPLDVVASTFPAGTLSGAPKYRALQLIDALEPTARGYYGGCLGFLSFSGDFHHAIMIRSLVSQGGVLSYQAGAGVVARSDIHAELREVDHKLAALRRALQLAEARFEVRGMRSEVAGAGSEVRGARCQMAGVKEEGDDTGRHSNIRLEMVPEPPARE